MGGINLFQKYRALDIWQDLTLLLSCCRFFLSSLNSSCSKSTHRLTVGSTDLGDPVIHLYWLNRGLVTCDGQGDHLVGGLLAFTLSQCCACLWSMGCCSKLNSCALSPGDATWERAGTAAVNACTGCFSVAQ